MKKNLNNNNTPLLITGLYIVATPIGNLSDFSLRAIQTLQDVDIIACEDTRTSRPLLNYYQISKKLISYHDYSDEKALLNIVNLIKEGKRVALISDAGSPLISDPGYKLVKACKEEGLYVTSIPGACAGITALQISGLSPQSFLFKGFLPVKAGDKRKTLINIQNYHDVSAIFYETAPRLLDTLEIILDVLGNIRACIARELTKKFEEATTDNISALIEYYKNKPAIKGEIVLILEIVKQEKELTNDDIKKALQIEMLNVNKKEAVKIVAKNLGLKKNIVYDIAISLNSD